MCAAAPTGCANATWTPVPTSAGAAHPGPSSITRCPRTPAAPTNPRTATFSARVAINASTARQVASDVCDEFGTACGAIGERLFPALRSVIPYRQVNSFSFVEELRDD